MEDSCFSRLGKCEVCASGIARYTCPRCEVKTCRLECVNIHKLELKCDGIRNRTKFIPLKEMSELDFRNDYYLLEDCARYVDARKTDRIKLFTHYKRSLPSHLNRLRREAQTRNITLRYLLQNFSRHKENTTYYNRQQNKIFWHIKWYFMYENQTSGSVYCCEDKRCDGEKLLETLLKKHLKPTKHNKCLELYYNADVNKDLKIFLLAEGVKRCGNRYYLVDVNKSVNENLARKTVVEYPCFYVSLVSQQKQWQNLNLIGDDEDIQQEVNEYYQELFELRKGFIEKYGMQAKCIGKDEPDKDESEDDNKKQQITSNVGESEKDEKIDNCEEEKNVDKTIDDKKIERASKAEEYYQTTNNFLFTDDNFLDILSSDEETDQIK